MAACTLPGVRVRAWCGVTLVVLAGAVVTGCDLVGSRGSGCTWDRTMGYPAPDGRHQAVAFRGDCGATTAYSTNVSVLDRCAPQPRGSGNAFTADDDHGAASTGPGGSIPLEVTWLSADRLRIGYPRGTRVFRHESSVDGVRVEYATLP